LKRLSPPNNASTGLKPGANESEGWIRLILKANWTKPKTPAATKLPPALFETVAGGLAPRLL